jgi:hypothetical protein
LSAFGFNRPIAGSKLQQTKRLSNITTYTNNDSLRDYDLSYQYYGKPLLIIGWISVKYSIRQAVAIYINQHRIFAIAMGWAVFPILIIT